MITSSAELEMTVNMLIQIDKLVQLLESPVFTCKLFTTAIIAKMLTFHRPPTTTTGTRQVPTLIQMLVWCSHAPSSKLGICCFEESFK
jgi:hypothetical protein